MNNLRDVGRSGCEGGGGSRYIDIALNDCVNGIWRISYFVSIGLFALMVEWLDRDVHHRQLLIRRIQTHQADLPMA
jgi:hypothetical protein